MADLMELSQDKRLRNHFNIDKKCRTSRHHQSSPHFHSYYELYFMKEGNCKYFLLDTVYELKKGDFILVPPEAYHIVSYDREGIHERYTLYFDQKKIDEGLLPFIPSLFDEPQAWHFRRVLFRSPVPFR